jgi:hypothetical protein
MFLFLWTWTCNQKERVQETYSPMRCTPPQTLGTHTLTVRFTSMYSYPILSANDLPARSPIQLNSNCNRLSNTRLDTRCDSDHASQMNVLKKIPEFSLSDYVHSPRAQALPWTSTPHNQRVWSFLKTLSVSPRNTCSNELNHTSDAAEDHDHGYQLLVTELLNLLLSFCPTLLAFSQHRRLPTQTDASVPKRDRISTAPILLHWPLHTILS